MTKIRLLFIFLCVINFSCKVSKRYTYIGSNCEKQISLIIEDDKVFCPIELYGKLTISLNNSIINSNENYYFLDSDTEVCYFDKKTKTIKNEDGNNLYYVNYFDNRRIVIVSALSGNSYEFVH